MVNYFQPRESFNTVQSTGEHNGGVGTSGQSDHLPEVLVNSEALLQLLLFVDKRPSSGEQIRHIRKSLQDFKEEFSYELQVIDVGEQPYLAEHFRLVATPCLLKIYPEPRQMLAGSNLTAQLEHWLPRWHRSAEEFRPERPEMANTEVQKSIFSIACTTEIMQLSDEVFRLKQEKEHLQEQLQLKDRIIAMLAHDLRNPLTAASLALETLEIVEKKKEESSLLPTPALTGNLIKQARRQLRIVERMITDILQAARGTNAQLHIQPEKVELASLCEEVLALFKERIETKSLKIETDIPKDLPCVYADLERVRQVIANLLDNAIKYTPENGTIGVSILHRTTQKVQVSICDSGPGIPKENFDRIFEDRFRLQRDEAKDGYGIGLSLCQRIIRAHYGQIWVDSVPNSGSCFHFTLPVHR